MLAGSIRKPGGSGRPVSATIVPADDAGAGPAVALTRPVGGSPIRFAKQRRMALRPCGLQGKAKASTAELPAGKQVAPRGLHIPCDLGLHIFWPQGSEAVWSLERPADSR